MIEPNKWYTISEVLKIGAERYFPIKTRLTLLRLIRNKRLPVLNAGTKQKPVYYFKGEWLLAFLSKYGQLTIHQDGELTKWKGPTKHKKDGTK